MDVGQQQTGLLEHLGGGQHLELALLNVPIHGGARLAHIGQGGQVLGHHLVHQLRGGQSVLLGWLAGASQTQDDHGPQVEPAVLQQQSGVQDLLGSGALLDLFQQFVIPGLHPQVRPLQAGFVQLFQLSGGLGHGGLGTCVGGDLLQVGEGLIEPLQDGQQLVLLHDDGVTIAQEHPADAVAIGLACHLNVVQNVLQRTDPEPLLLVHTAKSAGVVGAADGTLEQVALPLSGGTVNHAFISHNTFSTNRFIVAQNLAISSSLPMVTRRKLSILGRAK